MDCKKTALFFMLTAAACFFSCRVDIDGTGQMGGTGDSGEKPEDPSVEYNVSHLLQNINDDGYTEADCETLIGKPDCMTEAVQKDYEGFLLKDSVPNCKISSDGSTIVKIHYDRKLYEVVFDAGEGVFKGAGENGEDVRTVTRKFRHGQKIEPPEASSTKDGYKVQWPDFGTAGSGSVNSYTASWESGLVDYGIRSYFESVSGDFEEAEDKRSVKSGKPGTETSLGEIDAQSFTGFTFDHADNTVISEDGTSFVSFYYKRNSYTLTFDAGSGKFADGKSSVQKSFKYGQSVEIPEAELEGYSASWSGVPSTCPAENAKYTATWKANENTPYKIKHFLMNVDGKTWTERTSDASTGHGTTDSQTALTESNAKSYEGFTFNEVKNTTIAADGSSVVGFYYRRNYYTITFVAQGGTFETGTTVSSDGNAQVKVIYEGTVKAPYVSKAGYEVSWPEFEACTGAKTYTATWKPRNDTPYTLEVFVQQPESGEYTLESSKTQKGTTGETSAVTPEPREHYNAKVEQTVIKADGSGKAVVKYELKTSVLTFNAGEGIFKGAGAGGSDAKSVSLTLRYGQKVVVPEAFRDGYKAIWDGVPNVCPAENAAYTAIWKTNEITYKIKHFLMDVDGRNWTESTADESTGHGTIGDETAFAEADAKSYKGFVFYEVKNTTIAEDGSSVVEFYYRRNYYTITFVAEEGTFETGTTVNADGNAVVNVIYGGTVTAPNVTRSGYEVSWPAFETCTGAKTYTATWKACDVAYTVEHWRQNANDDEYTIDGDPISMTGKPGEKTKAKVKNSPGFELREPLAQQQVEIAADGSTVVKIYYDRKVFDITFDAGDGIFLGAGENGEDVSKITKKYRYYQKIPAAPKPYKEGYVPTWSTAFSATVKKSVDYVITWTEGAADTKYTVYHYQEKTDGSFEKDVTSKRESRAGVAGSMTKLGSSDAQAFAGFTFDHVENTIISADGKAIVKMYYKRNIIKLTLNAGDGAFADGSKVLELEGRYGAAVPAFEKPTHVFWDLKNWYYDNGSEHPDPTWGTNIPGTFPAESTAYKASWQAIFKLTAAKDNKGTDVLSNFSTAYDTQIEIYNHDVWLAGGSNPRWETANPTVTRCIFYHKEAKGTGDSAHYNAWWGNNGKVDLVKHELKGKFYNQSVTVPLSDDYKTITFEIGVGSLRTDSGKTPFKNGWLDSTKYTLTYTRQ